LKRELAPRFWKLHRKEITWAPNPHPGAHSRQKCIPLVMLLREMLRHARTSKEAEKIITRSMVKVDGRIRRDHRFSVGLMDVVNIAGINKTFRMLPKRRQGLSLVQIEERESAYKLCRITGKETIPGGQIQLALHDGRTILVSGKEQAQKPEEAYQVGGAVQVSLPGQRIVKYVPFRVGNLGLVTHGRNEGLYGRIAAISPGTHARRPIAKLETQDLVFETPAEYVLPIGTETPLVSLEK
jgi:small subunit ribosomal protein S4e